MLKKLRFPALALAAAMAVAVPQMTLAADRDHGHEFDRRDVRIDHHLDFRDRDRDRDFHERHER